MAILEAGQQPIIDLEQEELRGLSRTVAEIEWLLVILVLLFVVFGRPEADTNTAITMSLMFYAAFVMTFRYVNFFRRESRWKIAIETWGMLVFITAMVWVTGKLQSPLLNCYLLIILTSSLTLGKVTTMAETGLVAACFVLLAGVGDEQTVSLAFAGQLGAQIAPFVLVAYVTTMFSADIRYTISRAKLLSETDTLTDLLNIRGFVTVANQLFAQSTRYQRPASILMIDSDSLKRVNDSMGHESGNKALKNVAAAIRHEIRLTDIPARYGGDEFVVFLPETPATGAMDVAERIRRAVEELPVASGQNIMRCTVSIGIATFPEDGATLKSLIDKADHALYDAKQSGRNQVSVYSRRLGGS